MPPKLHLLILLGKQVDVILAGKRNGRKVFQCMRSEESMAGEDSKLAGTNFRIGKMKFQ
jgi:hypothetical protein